MSKPYDVVSKRLIELRPIDWVNFLGLPAGTVSLVDADLSTISVAADRIIRVDSTTPYLLHNELETGKGTASISLRLFQYNALAHYKFGLPVISTVFLLQRSSHSPQITGQFTIPHPIGGTYLTFSYNAIRVWELDVEQVLSGGLSLLPFAPISDVSDSQVSEIIGKMEQRIDAEAEDDKEAAEIWTATNVLMGLRYNKAFKAQLLKGVRRMRESITYQEILDEGEELGRLKEARRTLLLMGAKRFGIIRPDTEARIQQLQSLEGLEALLLKIFDVETWDELLADSRA